MHYIPQLHPAPGEPLGPWAPLYIRQPPVGQRLVSPDELVYLAGQHNYSWLYCQDGQRLLVPYTLRRMQAQLPPARFVRLHRSYMVNRQFVDRVETHPTGNHRLYLRSGAWLPVSRRSWAAVRPQLQLIRQGLVSMVPALVDCMETIDNASDAECGSSGRLFGY